MKKLLCMGYGYVAQFLTQQQQTEQFEFSATFNKNKDSYFPKTKEIKKINFSKLNDNQLDDFDYFVISIPPNYTEKTDPVLEEFLTYFLTRQTKFTLIYLSATSVYGDHQGATVSETAKLKANSSNGLARIACEKEYLKITKNPNANLFILRLAGIYGPKRNKLERLISGQKIAKFTANKIISRIHVADIANIIIKLATQNNLQHEIFNLCDDLPSSSEEIMAFIEQKFASKFSIEKPDFYPLTKNYSDNKIPTNKKLKDMLNYQFIYPDYKSGLKNCADNLD